MAYDNGTFKILFTINYLTYRVVEYRGRWRIRACYSSDQVAGASIGPPNPNPVPRLRIS